MKVIRLADSTKGPVYVEAEAPQPRPGPGEVLVRVHAAGVTPTELGWYPTSHMKSGERRTGAILGHEFSGVIAGVGDDVDSHEIGQQVYGMNDWFSDGATAEYCLAPWASVAPKPGRLTHTEAATVPISALTAWQGLIDRAGLRGGERVLVHGGAGAVGAYAVQLASLHGAHVITTASARDLDYVVSLGASQALDYRQSRFEDEVKQLDVVFDTVGGETLERSWGVLKPGGRLVTVGAGAEYAQDERTKQAFFIVEPNRKQLIEIGSLLDAGHLRAAVAGVVPLAETAKAYTGALDRRGRGKVAIGVIAET